MTRTSTPTLGLAAVALLSAVSVAAAVPAPEGCRFAPAIASDFPDPSILNDPETGATFAYATNIASPASASASASGGLINVPVSRAADAELAGWSAVQDALPRLPRWARGAYTWAPAVVAHPDDGYRLYFTARYGYSGRPCIGVAVSLSPAGPFIPSSDSKPLVCPLSEGGAIDPSVFRDDDGQPYLLWKTDTNCCDGAPTIYIQKLSADGLSLVQTAPGDGPWLLPEATPLIHTDQPWEGRTIEAPSLYKHEGRYYLFYSGGDYMTGGYAVGYASAASILGPYQKAPAPILTSSTSGLEGPGGEDMFDRPDGRTWAAFHAWQGQRPSRFRALYFGQVVWTPEGPQIRPLCEGR
jgi:beta-xylosidase